ncbi:hypothetical protein OHR68_01010 [Spirillospora sp. NBC_00431]
MTERGPFTGMRGAPGPAEPSNSGDSPAPAGRPQAVAGLPADLSAVRRTDAIIDSLAARRAAGSAARSPATSEPAADPEAAAGPEGTAVAGPECARQRQADDPDPAVRLLHALITDVDDQDPGSDTGSEPAPTGPQPAPPAPSGPGSGSRRRGPRTIVALGVAGAVLASTGVAAAGSGVAHRTTASPPSTSGVSDDAEKSPRSETDAGWHGDRSRSPVRSLPETESPARRKASDGRRVTDPPKTGPRNLYPRQWPRRPDAPTTDTYSTPSKPPRNGPATSPGAGAPPKSEAPPTTDDTPPTSDTPPKSDDQPKTGHGTGRPPSDSREHAQKRVNPYQHPHRHR